MDVLYWTLQDLNIPAVADVLEKNEQITARLIMDSASDAVERFLKRPDNLNRFDLAIVLTAIDDLIVVMARVIEYHERDMERPHDGFLESRGRESITRFVGVMGRLMVMMFRDLGKQAEDGGEAPAGSVPGTDGLGRRDLDPGYGGGGADLLGGRDGRQG